jgi:hypothetical protein
VLHLGKSFLSCLLCYTGEVFHFAFSAPIPWIGSCDISFLFMVSIDKKTKQKPTMELLKQVQIEITTWISRESCLAPSGSVSSASPSTTPLLLASKKS